MRPGPPWAFFYAVLSVMVMSTMAINHNLEDDFGAAIQMARQAAARDNMTYAICTQHRLEVGPDFMVIMPLTEIELNVLFTPHCFIRADGGFHPLTILGPH